MLQAALRAGGVDAVYGEAVAGLAVTPVASAELAALLARAHRRVHGRAAACLRGRTLTLPGPDPERITVESLPDVATLPGRLAAARDRGVVVTLDVDAGAEAAGVALESPAAASTWMEPAPDALAALERAERPVVLAGPGVVGHASVPGLHALAAAGHLGVLNTWGAKGVFNWQSRHHLATIGLQALDFALGGLPGSDLVIATGLDPDESPPERWQLGPFIEVDPRALSLLAERSSRSWPWPAVPELRQVLAAVTQEGWADSTTPLAPSLVTRNYGAALGDGGRVAAECGDRGLLARPDLRHDRAGIGAGARRRRARLAAAVALVTRLRTRPPSGARRRRWRTVGRDPRAPGARGLAGGGRRCGGLVRRRRGPGCGGAPVRARGLAVVERSTVATVATSSWQLDRILDVAGPVVAWGGLP